MELDPVKIWESMGLLARGVFFLLVGLSLVSVMISVDRSNAFRSARRQSLRFARVATPYLEAHELDAALDAAGPFQQSPLARVVAAGLAGFRRASSASRGEQAAAEAARRAIERTMYTTTAELRRGIPLLATIATVAPFVGLFGTILGIINAFTSIAEKGSGGIGAVSGGIAEALVITAIGLAVAIPAVALFNHFNSKVERFQMEMANASSELFDVLSAAPEGGAAARR